MPRDHVAKVRLQHETIDWPISSASSFLLVDQVIHLLSPNIMSTKCLKRQIFMERYIPRKQMEGKVLEDHRKAGHGEDLHL